MLHAPPWPFGWRIWRHDAVAALPGLAPQWLAHDLLPLTAAPSFLAQQQDRSARHPPLRCGPEGCGSAVAALTDRRQGPRWSRVQPAVKEITMAQIGTFTRDEDGSYTGTIRTLSLDIKVRFVPTEPSQNDKAPDLRVLAWYACVFIALSLLPTRRSCLAEGPERLEYLDLGKSRQ
jgi:hypothetical protein